MLTWRCVNLLNLVKQSSRQCYLLPAGAPGRCIRQSAFPKENTAALAAAHSRPQSTLWPSSHLVQAGSQLETVETQTTPGRPTASVSRLQAYRTKSCLELQCIAQEMAELADSEIDNSVREQHLCCLAARCLRGLRSGTFKHIVTSLIHRLCQRSLCAGPKQIEELNRLQACNCHCQLYAHRRLGSMTVLSVSDSPCRPCYCTNAVLPQCRQHTHVS